MKTSITPPLELKVCHSQNASQTPQADLSLVAAPQGLPPHSNKLNEKEKAAVGCPWDGRKPVWESEKVGSRSDPSRAVRLRCPKCGVSKGTVLSEAEESAASKLRMRDYPHSEISHQEASVQVVRDEVLKAWNKRK